MSDIVNYFKPVIIGECISELPKSKLPASAVVENGKYPFICSSSELKYTDSYLQDKSAVVMGTGGMASVHLGKDAFAYSTDTWAFRSNSSDVDTEFLFRKIQQLLPEIDYAAFEGSGLKHLRKDYVKKLEIAVPSTVEISNKILSILAVTDQAIEKTETLIEKYQQIKAGLMHDLFTRGINTDGKLRPPHEQAPELYQHTRIGWIPKEWEPKALIELVHFQRGYDIVEANFIEGKYPVISSGGIIGFHNEFTSKGPSVVIGRKGTIGKVHYIDSDFWAHDTSLFATNLFDNEPLFIYYLCNYLNLAKYGTKSGSPSLNRNDIHPLIVGKPSPIEQKSIVNRLNACDDKINSVSNEYIKLGYLKSGLMHDLLTGKVTVKIESEKPNDNKDQGFIEKLNQIPEVDETSDFKRVQEYV